MAFHTLASSSSAASAAASLIFSVTEKLSRNNHTSWKLQVLTALRRAQMDHFLENETQAPPHLLTLTKEEEEKKVKPKPNPEFGEWIAKDQSVLSFLLNSLSNEILGQVLTTVSSSKEVWTAIEAMFASQSQACIISTRMALATASKGASTVNEYYAKMKTLAKKMASAGQKLDDEELVSYILSGLDLEYNPVVTAITARVEPISVSELLTQLLSFEQRMEIKGGSSNPSANMAARGCCGGGNSPRGRNGVGRGGGGCGGFGRGRGGRGNGHGPNYQAGVICQVCGKDGHPAYEPKIVVWLHSW